MATLLLTMALMLAVMAAMAVGILLGRKPIRGSCGGISALAGDPECPLCGGDRGKCAESSAPSSPGSPPGTAGQPVRVDPGKRDS